MTNDTQYASLGIVDWQPLGAAVETLSITESECVLSGAWFVELSNINLVAILLSHRLLIEIGLAAPKSFSFESSTTPVTTDSFIHDAKIEGILGMEEFELFKGENPKKRKNLVEPLFTKWPLSLDLDNAAEHMRILKKAPHIVGTDPEMERVLTASRLAKWMIDGWLRDEKERFERPYTSVAKSGSRILPPAWLSSLPARI
ncbi:MAG: hypothetical protein WCO95_01495 [Actinomycetes bacterium]